MSHANHQEQNAAMRKYYEWQSKIYDSTRWSFLFGRHKVIQVLPTMRDQKINILEVGCGTGYNLTKLAKKYKQAQITGLDVSADMITLSRKNTKAFADRITLLEQPYVKGDTKWHEHFDLILFSYALTMMNPFWKDLIFQAKDDLKVGGAIGVADFYNSNFQWFKSHMGNHHVRMDGHLTPVLDQEFDTFYNKVRPAYGGIWHYFVYVGHKY